MTEAGPTAEPEIIAHRGYSSAAPENTLAALRAAIEAGAPAVEFDLRTAADGTPVLFHDARLGRTTTGAGPVWRRTVEELRSLDAGSWFSAEFVGERIPTLAEALELLDRRVDRIYPEVKGYGELAEVERMLEIVRSAGLLDRTVFISMDWGALDRIAGADPTVGIGYIVDDEERFQEALERASGDGRAILDLKAKIALDDPTRVAAARDRGVEVAVWTVDAPADAERLVGAGVTRITTNRVERLLAWRSGI